MRSLRFIFIGIITFLFVTNAVLWRKTVALMLCGVLSFNSTSCYSFLTQAETANATVSPNKILEHSQSPEKAQNIYNHQTINPLIANGKASSNTTPQYNFDIVARQGLVIGGQKVQDINTTIPWKRHRLIDEKGHIVFQDNGTIFRDNQAIAFVGQRIGDYFVKAVKDYFLFKDGTLDILLRVGDASPSSYGHYIITRNSQILIDKSGDLFDVVPGYLDTYYVRSVTHNGYFLKNGVTEVSEMPKRKESSPPNLPGANPYGCISNDKNQNVCSGLNFGYLVRDGGKYLPGISSPLAINNHGRVITDLMQVLDYQQDALPSLQAALAKSGNSQLEEIRGGHRSDLSASNLSSPIYANAKIPHRVQIPYKQLFGTTFNSLADKIRYLQLTDSGYMAIVLDDPVNNQVGSGVIIRATPSGSVIDIAAVPKCANLETPSGFSIFKSANGVCLYKQDTSDTYVTVVDLSKAKLRSILAPETIYQEYAPVSENRSGIITDKTLVNQRSQYFWDKATELNTLQRKVITVINGSFFNGPLTKGEIYGYLYMGIKSDGIVFAEPRFKTPGNIVVFCFDSTKNIAFIRTDLREAFKDQTVPNAIGLLSMAAPNYDSEKKMRTLIGTQGNKGSKVLLLSSSSISKAEAQEILIRFGTTTIAQLDGGSSELLIWNKQVLLEGDRLSGLRGIPAAIAVYSYSDSSQ